MKRSKINHVDFPGYGNDGEETTGRKVDRVLDLLTGELVSNIGVKDLVWSCF